MSQDWLALRQRKAARRRAATVKPMHESHELPMSEELLRRLREAGM